MHAIAEYIALYSKSQTGVSHTHRWVEGTPFYSDMVGLFVSKKASVSRKIEGQNMTGMMVVLSHILFGGGRKGSEV
jgi:hypothetical protein